MRVPRAKQSTAFLLFASLAGCYVEAQNHTPAQFPAQVSDLPTPAGVIYATTPEKVSELATDPKHRFILEVRPVNVSNVTAWISLNGTSHFMQGIGDGLLIFESADECQASYTYHFRISYRSGLADRRVALGSTAEPFTSSVSSFGDAIWYVPLLAPNTGDGEIRFTADAFEEQIVVVQNLRSTPIVPYFIGLDQLAGITENDEFEVLDLPTLPEQLDCGESLRFRVRWNAPSSTSSSTGAMRILANPIGGSAWWVTIILKGEPHPG